MATPMILFLTDGDIVARGITQMAFGPGGVAVGAARRQRRTQELADGGAVRTAHDHRGAAVWHRVVVLQLRR
ncbi:MAG: hypothetical protein ACR2ME_07775 [Acidimicrobiia bacterium]